MFGLGKHRSPFGEFLDKHGISQEDIVKATNLSRNTVSEICNNSDYKVRRSTVTLLLIAVKQLTGKSVNKNDFWA